MARIKKHDVPDLAMRLSPPVALRHSSNGSARYVSAIASEGNDLLRSSSALVMLPSLLSSMYARDTASAKRLSYCGQDIVLRWREC
jgi:hypothetical protein